jgi:DNA repair exonuclease SbcCD ATPase subunit
MKRIIILLAVASFFASCTNVVETKEYKALQAKNDSLETLASGQGNEIYDYLMDFNTIQENLNEIKKREKIISVNKVNLENVNKREQIKDDINTIYNLLKENQEKLKSLNKKYKSSGNKNQHLQKLINTLNQQIADKNSEIQILNGELSNLNIEIKDLTDDLLLVEQENEVQAQIIEDQENALQTAYYVVGTTKELKENGIITKEGGFIGIGRNTKLDDNFNKEYFTEINTESFNKIAIFSVSAKLVTTHPKNSYEFEGTDKKVDNLIIKDSKAFWSVSKYLVIEVKN